MPEVTKKALDGQLCAWCRNINLSELKSDDGYEHQPTFAALRCSSFSCDLCHLICRAIDKKLNERKNLHSEFDENSGPIKLISGHLQAQSDQYQSGNIGAGKRQAMGKVAIIIGREVNRNAAFSICGATLDMLTVKGSNLEKSGIPCADLFEKSAISKQNIAFLKSLLRECHIEHGHCSQDLMKRLMARHNEIYGSVGGPRRLVDVTMRDQTKVRVIKSTGSQRYATLSYCWGSYPQLCAARQNMSQFEKGVSVSSLCPAIQDAISITRYLDIPFLWVDALCIIQRKDNDADWASELQTMGLIYAQAYVTIAVTATDDCGKSFIELPRKSTFVASSCSGSLPITPDVLLFRLPFFDFAEMFESDVVKSALSQRAWAMQERLLSARTVYFTSTQIYWECRSLIRAENGETCTTLAYDGFHGASLFINSLHILEIGWLDAGKRETFVSMFLSSWCDVVARYSMLKLTHSRDKLFAIAGLARLASLFMPGAYLSGIWECDLANGLFWSPCEHPMQISIQKSAPSWSWASTVSPVTLCCRILSASRDSLINLKRVDRDRNGLEVLVIEGKLCECIVSEAADPYQKSHWPKDDTGANPNIPRYKFWLTSDYPECEPGISLFDCTRGSQTKYFFLPLALTGSEHCNGLILSHNHAGQSVYRRCGIGWYSTALPSVGCRQPIILT